MFVFSYPVYHIKSKYLKNKMMAIRQISDNSIVKKRDKASIYIEGYRYNK